MELGSIGCSSFQSGVFRLNHCKKNVFDAHLADVECCHGKNAQQQIDWTPNAHGDFGGLFFIVNYCRCFQ